MINLYKKVIQELTGERRNQYINLAKVAGTEFLIGTAAGTAIYLKAGWQPVLITSGIVIGIISLRHLADYLYERLKNRNSIPQDDEARRHRNKLSIVAAAAQTAILASGIATGAGAGKLYVILKQMDPQEQPASPKQTTVPKLNAPAIRLT